MLMYLNLQGLKIKLDFVTIICVPNSYEYPENNRDWYDLNLCFCCFFTLPTYLQLLVYSSCFSPNVRSIFLHLLHLIRLLLLASLNSMWYCTDVFVVKFGMSCSGGSTVIGTCHPIRVEMLFSYQCSKEQIHIVRTTLFFFCFFYITQ